ncbi:MAG: hypothetical protein S4CHLAM81_08870 [Chlamydiales bacterium]|nr:hypothetical protein [Chlamydiales bacterium]MCH9635667.1 hypothetical protein [Chlamydiales bacterium]MCH9703562.1 hypothetical protein [Chlamydiota bacterium]
MRTFWIVFGLHLIALFAFGIQKKCVNSEPGKIEVHTVQLQKPPPKKIPPPIEQPKRVVQVEKPKPKAASKKVATPKKRDRSALKKLLQESLETASSTKSEKVVQPQKVESLKSEALTFASYESLLVEYLEQLLELPVQGDVKLRLTLDRSGKVCGCEVVSACDANRRYIESEISMLRLPPFESHFKGEAKRTFPITLKTI